jgi:outer membrane protein W
MKKVLWICLVLAVAVSQPGVSKIEAGDKIVRFGPLFVEPTGESRTEIRVQEVIDTPEMGVGSLDADGHADLRPASAVGFSLGYEYLMTDRLGLAFEVGRSSHDIDVDWGGEATFTPLQGEPLAPVQEEAQTRPILGHQKADLTMSRVLLGFHWHLLRRRCCDLYLGPRVGYISYGDMKVRSTSLRIEFDEADMVLPVGADRFGVKSDVTWGAILGLDLALGRRGWLLSMAADYLRTVAQPTDAEVDVNPPDLDPWALRVGFGYRFH